MIAMDPVRGRDGSWALFQAYHRVHTSKYPFNILYLYAKATLADINAARDELSPEETTHVVYAPSLKARVDARKLFKHAKGIWTAREYLSSFLRDELQSYVERVTADPPVHYIDPSITTPGGFRRKYPNPVLNFLLDEDPGAGIPAGALAVVLAEPGQGKSYMSRYLVSAVARQTGRDLVPLIIDSSQWQTLPVTEQGDLWKTITHSFRHFESPIGWVEGNEDEFLRATLKADIFRIVFDGFDEYILRNRAVAQPIEVLETLSELARATGARIVITSRTSFWETNLPEMEINRFIEDTGSFVYGILPFDVPQATAYFKQRLTEPVNADRAAAIYRRLHSENEDLVGRGFVLSLLADLVERDSAHDVQPSDTTEGLTWLTRAMCEREAHRQQLPFSADQQLEILRTFATEVALGEQPSTDVLDYCMGLVRSDLDAGVRESCIEKFASHPLVEKDPLTDMWQFRQEQLKFLLLADYVLALPAADLLHFVDSASFGAGELQDFGGMILSKIRATHNYSAALARIKHFVRDLTSRSATPYGPLREGYASRLSGVIALRAVDRFVPKGRPHDERVALLFDIGGGAQAHGITFTGTVASYDFRGRKFHKCRFEQVTWANCSFDGSTVFSQCQFVGGLHAIRCADLADSMMVDCNYDNDSKSFFGSLQVRAGKRKYGEDDLKSDFESVLNKFITPGGIGLKTVHEKNLGRGSISASPHHDQIVDTVKSIILDSHVLSGSSDPAYHVRDSAIEAMKFYAVNKIFVGEVAGVYERLLQQLAVS
jgi:hypothetical protein